ncbi:MAG: polysaccharide deacetylase family protein [Candidatus Margulisiibacteriota bacterium]
MRRLLKKAFLALQKIISAVLYPFCILWNDLGSQRIPVLMYHKVCDLPAESTEVRYDNVLPRRFAEQMEFLYKNGYRVLHLEEYLKWNRGQTQLPRRSVLITLDDGYKSVYTNALPVLKKYGFPAAVFLTTDYIGGSRVFDWLKWDKGALADRERKAENWLPLSWDEVREMIQEKISIGSHTRSHPHLAKLKADQIKNEVRGSRLAIENEIKKRVGFFSYPVGIARYGAFNSRTKEELRANGYDMAFISEIGRNRRGQDPYVQKRIAISESDMLFDLKCKLVGAYDWAGFAQRIFQRMFREVD